MIDTLVATDLDPLLARMDAAAGERDGTPGMGLDAEIGWLEDAGLLYSALPAKLSGQRGWSDDPLAIGDLLRRVGAASLPVGRLFEGHVNAAQLIGLYGSASLANTIRADVANGCLLGVWGADSADPVVAEPADGGYRLCGTKCFCSGVGLVKTALVSASLDGKIALFAVDVGDDQRSDASVWRVGGMRATRSGDYCFDGMMLGADALVGPLGSYYAEPAFLGGMYRICAVQAGGLEALLDAFIAALRRRNRADNALAKHRVGLVACQAMTARAVTTDIAGLVAECSGGPIDSAKVAHRAILAREAVEGCVVEALQLIERGAGTEAHREPTRLSRIRRDLGLYVRQAAVDERLAMVGAALLKHGRGLA